MAYWALVLAFAAAALLLRRQGDPWVAVVAKLAALVALSAAATVLVAGLLGAGS